MSHPTCRLCNAPIAVSAKAICEECTVGIEDVMARRAHYKPPKPVTSVLFARTEYLIDDLEGGDAYYAGFLPGEGGSGGDPPEGGRQATLDIDREIAASEYVKQSLAPAGGECKRCSRHHKGPCPGGAPPTLHMAAPDCPRCGVDHVGSCARPQPPELVAVPSDIRRQAREMARAWRDEVQPADRQNELGVKVAELLIRVEAIERRQGLGSGS